MPTQGNRQDNRSRGNAAQLHEKYKSLARDSQLSGDRVQTEYYLQFADHYYRVLNENRARFEDQRPRRDDFMDEDDDGEEMIAGVEGEADEPQQQQPRRERFERREREPRFVRETREPREMRPARVPGDNEEIAVQPAAADDAPPRRTRSRRNGAGEGPAAGEERISLDVLPPAIAAGMDPAPGVEGEAAKPVRRRAPRRPRDGGEDIAPAA